MSRYSVLLSRLPHLISQKSFQILNKDLSGQEISNNFYGQGIDDNALYTVGFARRFNYEPNSFINNKLGFARLDIVHSILFFQRISPINLSPLGAPLAIGRLPPFFQKPSRKTSKTPEMDPRLKNPLPTRMRNEKHYWFLSWRPLDVTMPAQHVKILAIGHEIKTALTIAEDKICKDQIGDMVHSNCYSATIYFYCVLSHIILKSKRSQQQKSQSLFSLLGIIHNLASHHSGIGVKNNTAVLNAIEGTINAMEQFGYGNLLNPSSLDYIDAQRRCSPQ